MCARSTSSALVRGATVIALLSTLILTSALSLSAAPTALPTIDHFDSTQGPLNAYLATPASSSVVDANVLGGERDMVVTVLSSSVASPPAGMSASAGASLLTSSQDSGVVGQAVITYDGIDGDPNVLNATGLGGVDLTIGGADNGFSLTSRLNDLPIDIYITVYSNATSASVAKITLPGAQPSNSPPVKHVVEYAAFSQLPAAASPANFASVGAIVLLIDGLNDASDLTIDEFKIISLDWGDLPNTSVGGPNYPTTYADNGPRHVISSLILGALIDPSELNGVPSLTAKGDDTTGQADEDGVKPTVGSHWQSGANGGFVTVVVAGGPGCLSGWIDWGNDGSLVNAGDNVLNNVLINTGSTDYTFFVPTNPGNGSFYARFRLYPVDTGNVCTSIRTPVGLADGGEVEDYLWSFGPLAVTINALQASPAQPMGLPVAFGAIIAAAVGLWQVRRRAA